MGNGEHLGKLKGIQGDQYYSLAGINTGEYDTGVIYCQPFGGVFGTDFVVEDVIRRFMYNSVTLSL